MTERCLVDTNILVYAYGGASEKRGLAIRVLDGLQASGTGALSAQNLAEFGRVVTEKIANPLSNSQARNIVLGLAKSIDVVEYDSNTVADALSLCERHGIHFFDALLVATMERHGITKIVTENDADFKRVPWLTVVNPFKRV